MRALDRALYLLWAAALTLVAARTFYGYMLVQTGGEWSAPLDDVFIHFDYARAAARGYPFQWSEGNGYSSGNTSLLYPFALAVGYAVGFTQQRLMIWAALVACGSVLALLLAARHAFAGLPRWTHYFAPPAVFCIGALDWSLFSGMEVAFFLAVWAGAFAAACRCVDRIQTSSEPPVDRSTRWPRLHAAETALGTWQLGLWGVLVVWTRPEGATSLAVLGLMVALVRARDGGTRAGLMELVRAGLPGILALGLQSVANRVFTGESSANGAIVKLALYNPYMPTQAKLEEYRFLLEYVVRRNVEHHFSTVRLWGWVVPVLAAVPLFCAKTRRIAIVLWSSALAWLAAVALNGQVRWQNERYTMPAVAWVLLLAAMGIAVLVAPWGALAGVRRHDTRRDRAGVGLWLARGGIALVAVIGFWRHQIPCMRDQIWFFGRACRNIRDQHITAGRMLAQITPKPRRVMVGDAGALMYASDLPGLDLIGLGGYHDLPFARASVHGLGATLELLERMPRKEWPDVMAIYPSWWGDLPAWFGRPLFEVPVLGNVICGGAEKVVYQTDWSALGRGATPVTLRSGERLVDDMDVADLVSEREHHYEFPHPNAGFVDMKVLADPTEPAKDLFDAGRRIPAPRSERFQLRAAPDLPSRIVIRTAVEHAGLVDLVVDGKVVASFALKDAPAWQELSADLPASGHVVLDIELVVKTADWVDHHVWLLQAPR